MLSRETHGEIAGVRREEENIADRQLNSTKVMVRKWKRCEILSSRDVGLEAAII